MARANADGVRIDYDDAGRGSPALLLMPGWCASRRAFDPVVPLLAKRHRVLSLDWRGHGRSGPPPSEFGGKDLVLDALAVIAAAGSPPVLPVATAHAGWVAIELRRALGATRVPALVLVDWILTEAPPPFLEGLAAMQKAGTWKAARDGLFELWKQGVDNPAVHSFIDEDMGKYGQAMWARAGREIAGAYAREGSPFRALAGLRPPAPTLHVYAQPPDPGYLAAQRAYGAENPWFKVEKLDAKSHLPTIEAPRQVAEAILEFVAGLRG